MKKVLTTMVGAALLVGAAVPAFAQDPTAAPVGLSIRAGIFLPTDSGVKDVSDSWVSGGLDYRLKSKFNFLPGAGHMTVSLDYASKGDFRVVPILLNYVIERDSLYAFGGAGVAFSRRPFGTGSDDKARFGYQFGIGLDVQKGSHPIFVEGKFMGNEVSKFNGFGIYLGFRL